MTTATLGTLGRHHNGNVDRLIHVLVDGRALCDSTRTAEPHREGPVGDATCRKCRDRAAEA